MLEFIRNIESNLIKKSLTFEKLPNLANLASLNFDTFSEKGNTPEPDLDPYNVSLKEGGNIDRRKRLGIGLYLWALKPDRAYICKYGTRQF